MTMETEIYAGIRSEEGHLDGPRQDSKFECPETILEGPLGQLVVAERGGPWLRLIDNQSVSTQQLLGHLQGQDVELDPCGCVYMTTDGQFFVNCGGRM